jgi:hypothetical protein
MQIMESVFLEEGKGKNHGFRLWDWRFFLIFPSEADWIEE